MADLEMEEGLRVLFDQPPANADPARAEALGRLVQARIEARRRFRLGVYGAGLLAAVAGAGGLFLRAGDWGARLLEPLRAPAEAAGGDIWLWSAGAACAIGAWVYATAGFGEA